MIVENASHDPAPSALVQRHAHQKRAVAATSVAAAVILTGMKLAVGLATGSLGILSEALHSALDLVAALITWFAVQASARPADVSHPFGHGKVENLSALFETLLLLATCGWIIVEATKRLTGGGVEVEASLWAFVVMGISIVIDISRSRALMRVARLTGSQALEADALHFSTDVWSSSVVIAGLVAVRLAPTLGAPWLAHADAVAALGVAGIVVWVSLRLGRRTLAELLDEMPLGLRDRVEEAARVSGVLDVVRVRVRRSGSEHFVDLTLRAEPDLTLEQAHVLADRVERAVRERLAGADVVVHLEPASSGSPPIPSSSAVRSLARRSGVDAHAVRVESGPDGPVLELHVEVDRKLDVAAAHGVVRELETQLRRRFPALARVVSHIEPRELTDGAPPAATAEDIRLLAEEVAAARGILCRASDVVVTRSDEGIAVSFLCATTPHAAITEAHALTTALESALHERFPDIDRVAIRIVPLPPS